MNKKAVAIKLFAILFIIGVFVFDDYGISMDEEVQREHGIVTYRWLNRKLFNRGVFVDEGTENIEKYGGRIYGVALQLPVVFAEDVYHIVNGEAMSFRTIYLVRHAYLYCWFLIGLYCFYCLLCDLYNNPLLSAAGVLMVFVFGRVFADSFYNVKDMLFTSVSMVDLLLAERVIRFGRSTKWCIIYAVSTAFLVSSRIVGAIYPLLLIIFMLLNDFHRHRKLNLKPYLLICSSYFIWLLITPASWNNPLKYSFGYAKKFSNYNPQGKVLFDGIFYTSRKLPSDYYLRWIAISVPLVFLLFCIIGLSFFLKRLIALDSIEEEDNEFQMLGLALGVFGITILYQMIKHPTVYNGWRHVYYLYPLIILMSVKGIHSLFSCSKLRWQRWTVIFLLCGSILYNGVMIACNHPFEFMALNSVGQLIGSGYERDYWEAGVYHVMSWIIDNETEDAEQFSIGDVDVVRDNLRADYFFLPADKQKKIFIPTSDTDYIIFRHNSPSSDSAVIEGYTKIKEFFTYNIKAYSVFKRE